MRAAAMKECLSFPMMRQTNVQSILPTVSGAVEATGVKIQEGT